MKMIRQKSPIQFKISNKTKEVKNIHVFGAAFNDWKSDDVEPTFSNVTYKMLMVSSIVKTHRIGFIRFQCSSPKANKKKFWDNIYMTVNDRSETGHEVTIPVNLGAYHKGKCQYHQGVVDCTYKLKISAFTQVSFNLPEETDLIVTMFPETHENSISDFEHPLSQSVNLKYIQASEMYKYITQTSINEYNDIFRLILKANKFNEKEISSIISSNDLISSNEIKPDNPYMPVIKLNKDRHNKLKNILKKTKYVQRAKWYMQTTGIPEVEQIMHAFNPKDYYKSINDLLHISVECSNYIDKQNADFESAIKEIENLKKIYESYTNKVSKKNKLKKVKK